MSGKEDYLIGKVHLRAILEGILGADDKGLLKDPQIEKNISINDVLNEIEEIQYTSVIIENGIKGKVRKLLRSGEMLHQNDKSKVSKIRELETEFEKKLNERYNKIKFRSERNLYRISHEEEAHAPAITSPIKQKFLKLLEQLMEEDISKYYFHKPAIESLRNDPKNFSDYQTEITHPKCVEEVEKSLKENEYLTTIDFAADVRLIWYNCKTFNKTKFTEKDDPYTWGEYFIEKFEYLFFQELEELGFTNLGEPPVKPDLPQVKPQQKKAKKGKKDAASRKSRNKKNKVPKEVLQYSPQTTVKIEKKDSSPENIDNSGVISLNLSLVRKASKTKVEQSETNETYNKEESDNEYQDDIDIIGDINQTPTPKREQIFDLKQAKLVIESLKSLKHSEHFKGPVDKIKYGEYYEKINEPMDLKTMEEKVLKEEYKTIEEFKNDASIIWQNGETFLEIYGEECFLKEDIVNFKKYFRRLIKKLKKGKDIKNYCHPMTVNAGLLLKKLYEMEDVVTYYWDLKESLQDDLEKYRRIIQRPIDLGTVDDNLKKGEYFADPDSNSLLPFNFEKFENDVKLVFQNSIKYWKEMYKSYGNIDAHYWVSKNQYILHELELLLLEAKCTRRNDDGAANSSEFRREMDSWIDELIKICNYPEDQVLGGVHKGIKPFQIHWYFYFDILDGVKTPYKPMDFSRIRRKMDINAYESKEEFFNDAKMVFDGLIHFYDESLKPKNSKNRNKSSFNMNKKDRDFFKTNKSCLEQWRDEFIEKWNSKYAQKSNPPSNVSANTPTRDRNANMKIKISSSSKSSKKNLKHSAESKETNNNMSENPSLSVSADIVVKESTKGTDSKPLNTTSTTAKEAQDKQQKFLSCSTLNGNNHPDVGSKQSMSIFQGIKMNNEIEAKRQKGNSVINNDNIVKKSKPKKEFHITPKNTNQLNQNQKFVGNNKRGEIIKGGTDTKKEPTERNPQAISINFNGDQLTGKRNIKFVMSGDPLNSKTYSDADRSQVKALNQLNDQDYLNEKLEVRPKKKRDKKKKRKIYDYYFISSERKLLMDYVENNVKQSLKEINSDILTEMKLKIGKESLSKVKNKNKNNEIKIKEEEYVKGKMEVEENEKTIKENVNPSQVNLFDGTNKKRKIHTKIEFNWKCKKKVKLKKSKRLISFISATDDDSDIDTYEDRNNKNKNENENENGGDINMKFKNMNNIQSKRGENEIVVSANDNMVRRHIKIPLLQTKMDDGLIQKLDNILWKDIPFVMSKNSQKIHYIFSPYKSKIALSSFDFVLEKLSVIFWSVCQNDPIFEFEVESEISKKDFKRIKKLANLWDQMLKENIAEQKGNYDFSQLCIPFEEMKLKEELMNLFRNGNNDEEGDPIFVWHEGGFFYSLKNKKFLSGSGTETKDTSLSTSEDNDSKGNCNIPLVWIDSIVLEIYCLESTLDLKVMGVNVIPERQNNPFFNFFLTNS